MKRSNARGSRGGERTAPAGDAAQVKGEPEVFHPPLPRRGLLIVAAMVILAWILFLAIVAWGGL